MNMSSLPAESPSHRSYFYVGGQYVECDEKQHVMTGQMYVEKLLPVNGATHRWPLVFIHGAGQTGTVSAIHFLLPNAFLFLSNRNRVFLQVPRVKNHILCFLR